MDKQEIKDYLIKYCVSKTGNQENWVVFSKTKHSFLWENDFDIPLPFKIKDDEMTVFSYVNDVNAYTVLTTKRIYYKYKNVLSEENYSNISVFNDESIQKIDFESNSKNVELKLELKNGTQLLCFEIELVSPMHALINIVLQAVYLYK